jgi:hypothetical protein
MDSPDEIPTAYLDICSCSAAGTHYYRCLPEEINIPSRTRGSREWVWSFCSYRGSPHISGHASGLIFGRSLVPAHTLRHYQGMILLENEIWIPAPEPFFEWRKTGTTCGNARVISIG